MATQTLTLTTTRYKGTSVDTQVNGDYIGNVFSFAKAEYYRLCLSFKPTKTLSKVVLQLAYGSNYNQPTNVTYRYAVASSCPATTSTSGTAFTWSSSAATITISQTFTANTTYKIWLWSPSTTQGYVALSSKTATGTIYSYTIKYDANGGSGAPSNQTKDYGATLTLSSTKPTRTGYTFQGWATSSTATTVAYSAGDSYTANASATLYAVWKINTYKITLPTGTGYTIKAVSGYSSPVDYGGTYKFTVTISTGYIKGDGFAVKANGTTLTPSGSTYTISNIKAAQTITVNGVELGGLVYIDNGTGFVAYQVYIDNGTEWVQYMPYIDNGTGWDLCT